MHSHTATAAATTATIMIMDDESGVRSIERIMLERAGYTVMTAASGPEALSLVSDETPLDLLVADLHMPEMTGDEVARRLRARRPDLKVLYVTGYVDTLFDNRPVLWDGEAFLDKPFSSRGLVEAVSLLLHGHLPEQES